MSEQKTSVVIVEDDFVDLELVKRGMRRRDLDYDVYELSDGNQALEFLRGKELSPERMGKLIILLDINMPGMNGHQFLTEIRADETLKKLIVFVLSTSNHHRDKSKAYEHNVAGYFVKSNLDGLLDTLAVYTENVEFPPVAG